MTIVTLKLIEEEDRIQVDRKRNGFMLKSGKDKDGYDWWWHSFTAEDDETGELEPFFIEYYVINPRSGNENPIFGQIPGSSRRPSYAMIKAGKWGEMKAQINNFFGIAQFRADENRMNVQIGRHSASETSLKGSVELTEEEANLHPEYMSDSGSMSWDLKVRKELSYSVGYGASRLFRLLNLFQMFWHVQGMKSLYSGTVIFKGRKYTVKEMTSHGYQDKNWGRDYTNPWVWLNCNNFQDHMGNKRTDASLDIGGGNPRILGFSLGAKLLGAFSYQGIMYEFNFSYILFQKQKWKCSDDDENIFWEIDLSNRRHRLLVKFCCPKEKMLKINYENPAGRKNHNNLWNGGHASGTLELSDKKSGEKICSLIGTLGGCEYGAY